MTETRPKVLQIIAAQQQGLAEAMFERLSLALAAAGMPPTVAVRRHSGRAKRLGAAGLQVTELPFSRHHESRTRRGVQRLIESCQPHLVVSWLARAAYTVPRADCANLGFVHLGVPGRDGRPRDFRSCGHLLLFGEQPAGPFLAAGWPETHIHRLPILVRGRPAGPVGRWSHTTPEEATLLIAVGRMGEKGESTALLEALDRLPPDFYLWIVGDGPGRSAMETEARARALDNRVRFLGWRHDTDSLIAAADIFVNVADDDLLGAETVEAWAQARPVVSVSSPAGHMLIQHGSNGLLAPAGDGQALAEAVVALADNRVVALHMALAGRQSYEVGYTERRVVDAYQELFTRLAREAPSKPSASGGPDRDHQGIEGSKNG